MAEGRIGFDAVLTDAIMPEMSGTQLVQQLKARRPELPVILMSGFAGPDLQAQALAAGAQAVLAKPLTSAELAHCLAGALAAQRESQRLAV